MTPWSRSQGRDGEARCTFASGAGSPVPAYDALLPSCGFSSGTAHTRAPVRTREPREFLWERAVLQSPYLCEMSPAPRAP